MSLAERSLWLSRVEEAWCLGFADTLFACGTHVKGVVVGAKSGHGRACQMGVDECRSHVTGCAREWKRLIECGWDQTCSLDLPPCLLREDITEERANATENVGFRIKLGEGFVFFWLIFASGSRL